MAATERRTRGSDWWRDDDVTDSDVTDDITSNETFDTDV